MISCRNLYAHRQWARGVRSRRGGDRASATGERHAYSTHGASALAPERNRARRTKPQPVQQPDAGAAVNPNAVVKIDTRTPEEVIQSIAHQGEIVAQALGALKALLQ
jgi:hypothetical protein